VAQLLTFNHKETIGTVKNRYKTLQRAVNSNANCRTSVYGEWGHRVWEVGVQNLRKKYGKRTLIVDIKNKMEQTKMSPQLAIHNKQEIHFSDIKDTYTRAVKIINGQHLLKYKVLNGFLQYFTGIS
jgi:hypothetical protein